MAKQISLPALFPIPINWQWIRIDALTSMKSGFPFDSNRFSPDPAGRMPLIRIRDVVRGSTDTYTDEPCPDEYIINSGDVLIGMDGDFNVAKWKSEKALLNQRVCTIRSVSDQLLNEYLFHFLPDSLKKINDATPSVTVKHLSTKTLGASSIPLPPLPEQQRIVDRIESLFAKLDEAKEKAQAVVDGFEDRKAAILHKAFIGELTAEWRKDNGYTYEQWETVPLKAVCRVNPPKVDTKCLSDDLEVSFFPMPALSEISGMITDPQVRKLSEVKSGFTNFSEGDVVFAKITPCMENGKSAVIGQLVNGIGYGTTEFFVMRCGEKLNNRYLWHMMRARTFRDKAKAEMTGAVGQQRVPKGYLENYQFELPPVEEQHAIVRILDASFEKELQVKLTAEQVISQIDTMKKAILARAFRGELGTNDPSEPPADMGISSVNQKNVHK